MTYVVQTSLLVLQKHGMVLDFETRDRSYIETLLSPNLSHNL